MLPKRIQEEAEKAAKECEAHPDWMKRLQVIREKNQRNRENNGWLDERECDVCHGYALAADVAVCTRCTNKAEIQELEYALAAETANNGKTMECISALENDNQKLIEWLCAVAPNCCDASTTTD